jgi:NADH-quinone oxidoreductase subunit G
LRFEARPWEIQNVPSVCGLCPVGCNITATTREGKVKRILSRNHPDVDQGWICDKGRFGFTHLYAGDRVTEPMVRAGRRRVEEAPWDDALDEAERLLRAAQGRVLVALSGSETVEQAFALSRLVRQGLGSNAVVLPEETSADLDPFRIPLRAIADAQVIAVVGDEPVAERAPIVDLWLRLARRRGAQVITAAPDGTEQVAPGSAPEALRRFAADERLTSAERVVLIWSGPGGRGGADLAELARTLGLDSRPGSGALYLPATPNGRGVAEAWAAAGEGPPAGIEKPGCLIVSGDEAAESPSIRALAERSEAVIAISMYRRIAATGWADVVLPATSYLEKDGTLVNLEGRLQRVRRSVIPPAPDELAWIAKLAGRFDVDVSPYPAHVFEELYGFPFAEIGEQAPLRERRTRPPETPARAPARPTQGGGPLQLVRYRPLFSGPAVERVHELQFQRPIAEIELAPQDAQVRGISTGDIVRVSSNGTSVELRARINPGLIARSARAAEEHTQGLQGGVEVQRA